jgi:poly-gamma-glutamate capsule biosynthesis protein CapA/YwtB (metallophosphatase superfamily)
MPADQSADSIPQADLIRLFLCGDVMTGRGIDQVLPHPTDPTLHEPYIGDARSYVERAESVNGAIPRPVEFDYIWGDALAELDRAGVDLRIINLETSITSSEDYWRDKEIHYRMHPRNIDCITAARIDCCCLANNHVLDWGYDGLAETLRTLDAAGIAHTGAGRDAVEAAAPAGSMCREKAACSSSRMVHRRAAFRGNGPRPLTGPASTFSRTLRRKLRAASPARFADSTASAM